jgi:hypothetical protein
VIAFEEAVDKKGGVTAMEHRPPARLSTSVEGMPPSRAELLVTPGLFLLNPANRAFIAGDTQQIEPPGPAKRNNVGRLADEVLFLIRVLLAAGIFVVIVPFAYVSENDPWATGLIAAVLGGYVVWAIRSRYRHYRLRKHGTVLAGVLMSWNERKGRGKGGTGPFWFVKVGYCFTAPDGQTIYGRKEFYTRDSGWLVGQSGWPIAVVYANKRTYDML